MNTNFREMKKRFEATLKELNSDNRFASQIGQSESVVGQEVGRLRNRYQSIASNVSFHLFEATAMNSP